MTLTYASAEECIIVMAQCTSLGVGMCHVFTGCDWSANNEPVYDTIEEFNVDLKMIGKGFYRKWVKSSFEQFITTQTWMGSTNGWIIAQNAEILKFYFSTIFEIWRHKMATFTWMCP